MGIKLDYFVTSASRRPHHTGATRLASTMSGKTIVRFEQGAPCWRDWRARQATATSGGNSNVSIRFFVPDGDPRKFSINLYGALNKSRDRVARPARERRGVAAATWSLRSQWSLLNWVQNQTVYDLTYDIFGTFLLYKLNVVLWVFESNPLLLAMWKLSRSSSFFPEA